jgi:hypothetical protein
LEFLLNEHLAHDSFLSQAWEGGKTQMEKWGIHWQNGNTFIDSVTRTFAYYVRHEWKQEKKTKGHENFFL